jgi:hypothetical protein
MSHFCPLQVAADQQKLKNKIVKESSNPIRGARRKTLNLLNKEKTFHIPKILYRKQLFKKLTTAITQPRILGGQYSMDATKHIHMLKGCQMMLSNRKYILFAQLWVVLHADVNGVYGFVGFVAHVRKPQNPLVLGIWRSCK